MSTLGSFLPRESEYLVLEPGSLYTKAGIADNLNPPAMVQTGGVLARLLVVAGTSGEFPHRGQPTRSSTNQNQLNNDPDPSSGPFFPQTAPTATALVSPSSSATAAAPEPGSEALPTYVFEPLPPDVDAIRPVKEGIVVDWPALTAFWKHLLITLGMRRARNTSAVLLSLPITWSRTDSERAAQILFEEFNVPCVYVVDQPLAVSCGCNCTTALVVDIGHETTDIVPIVDSTIIRHATFTLPLGGRDVDRILARSLANDEEFVTALGKAPDVNDARAVKEAGGVDASARGGLDGQPVGKLNIEIDGKKLSIDLSHSACIDVLVEPDAFGVNVLSIPAAISLAVTSAVEAERRQSLWENIILTGGSGQLKGLRQRLEHEMAPFIAATETSNEYQPKEIKWRDIPEYITELKSRPQDAGFIGASILAKVCGVKMRLTFGTDYNEMGPAAVYLKA
ncbi:hypothetical protein BDK51DRAFT_25420 [Blyttiomyces helicus]|uniref:Actin family n=1 Tax=Blyttiomyces helicus TaxID=388810 RepID=A0A4P9WFG8_9FUNG|nr:hypothetical protein BDK51DRAFT_25420 [Blyttiomyces helicus]|eukprot:RKO89176.1 hypothetical protein BDK51DRAFT_25420 [Blyttiomyces helicus]